MDKTIFHKEVRRVLSIMFLALFSCCNGNKTLSSERNSEALRAVIIYKTTKDYSNNIPLMMNEDKTEIVSYPAISDISDKKKPQNLIDGYLLDNFGICKNTVYTSYTFEDYKKLTKQPTIQELKTKIIDFNPFVEIYKYNKVSPSIEILNQEISNKFINCRKL